MQEQNERDTQFIGFAKLLMDELDIDTPYTEEREHWERKIARRAYDLVAHILNQTPTGTIYIRMFKDMESWPERERFADTLADLAKLHEKLTNGE